MPDKIKLDDIVSVLEKIVQTARRIMPVAKDDYELEQFVYLNYFERFAFALESVSILLKEFNAKPHLENSIGLIVRASLLDFMTLNYLIGVKDDIELRGRNDSEFDDELARIMTDHVLSTFNFLKQMRNMEKIDQSIYKTTIDCLIDTYPFVFTDAVIDYENPKAKLRCKKGIGASELHTELHKNPLTIMYSDVYDLYTYYSKYEHWGIMTHYMQRLNPDNNINVIIDGLIYVLAGINISFGLSSWIEPSLDKKEISFSLEVLYNEFLLIVGRS